MKMLLSAATLSAAIGAAAILAAPSALACDGMDTAKKNDQTAQAGAPKDPKEAVGKVSVDQLATQLKAAEQKKAKVTVFDVNSDETRQAQGVIPTAVLLPSSKDYDLAMLPKDKAENVIFYCSNTQCGASKTAAVRAVEAGHKNVSVLPEGIAGWLKAGKPVAKQPVG